MPITIIRRATQADNSVRAARFGIGGKRVIAIVMPPLPPRPSFFRPQLPSGLSADNVALRLGLVRKIDSRTGRMHFEKRQIRDLRSDIRTKKMAAKQKALQDWADDFI
jgi:hypothetical protein